MNDLNTVLREYDRRMREALDEAEDHLRSGGVEDWELVLWREAFLPIWNHWVQSNRRILQASLTEPQSTMPH